MGHINKDNTFVSEPFLSFCDSFKDENHPNQLGLNNFYFRLYLLPWRNKQEEAVLILFVCVYKLTELFFFYFTALLFININFYVFLSTSVHINNLRESV